jgi:hypothetical protein
LIKNTAVLTIERCSTTAVQRTAKGSECRRRSAHKDQLLTNAC